MDKIKITKADAEMLLRIARRVPGRLQALVVQMVIVRQAFEAHAVSLSEYAAALRVEIAKAEHSAREAAAVTGILKDLLDHAEIVDGAWHELNGWSK